MNHFITFVFAVFVIIPSFLFPATKETQSPSEEITTQPVIVSAEEIETESILYDKRESKKDNEDVFEKEYNGYICYLKEKENGIIEVYIKPNEDCFLQAFDIYLDTEGHEFSIESHTGHSIVTYRDRYNLMSIANGLEMKMKANTSYKICTITLESDSVPYCVGVLRADLAIAFTPFSPNMDDSYLDFPRIVVKMAD